MTAPEAFRVVGSSQIAGGYTIVASGELDLATAPALRAAVEAADGSAGSQIHLDLEGVTFIDSTGLHELLAIREAHPGQRLRFTISPAIHRLLDIVGLHEWLDDQREAAPPN